MKAMIASAIMAAALVAPAAADIQPGLLAPRGPGVATAEWSALAAHLSTEIGETVALPPLRAA